MNIISGLASQVEISNKSEYNYHSLARPLEISNKSEYNHHSLESPLEISNRSEYIHHSLVFTFLFSQWVMSDCQFAG